MSYSARTQCAGGGTAIFINCIDNLDILTGNLNDNIEKCFEYCKVHITDFNLIIVALYRPPSGHFDTFVDALEGVLSRMSGKRLIFAGDFNIKFGSSDTQETRLLDITLSFGLKPTIFEATRGPSCLDNIFLDCDIALNFAKVANINLSDHQEQMVGSPFPLRNSGLGRKIEKKVYRPITQKGKNLFHNFLGGLSWDFIDGLDLNVNLKFEIFMNTLHNAYLECFHEKTYSKRTDQS